MCEITASSPLANFLQTLNVAKSSIIVVDNARPIVTDSDRIATAPSEPHEESPELSEEEPQEQRQDNEDMPVRKRRKRRVSFNYKVRVVKCSAFKNTDELFYTNKEYKKMRKEIKATLLRHQINQQDDSSSCSCSEEDDSIDCMRGLETFLEDARIAKNRARLHASLAVFTEQNRQFVEDGNVIPLDEQELSRRYQQVSFKCQREAIERGLQDCVATTCPVTLACKSIQQSLGYDHCTPPITPKFRAVSSYAA